MNAPLTETADKAPAKPAAKRVYEVRRVWDEVVLGTRITSAPEYDWLDEWLETFTNEEPLEDLMYCSTAVQNGKRTWWRRADGHAEKCRSCDGKGAVNLYASGDETFGDDCGPCEGTGWDCMAPKPDYLTPPPPSPADLEAKRKLKEYERMRKSQRLPAAAE